MNASECKLFLCPCKLLNFTPKRRKSRKALQIIEQYVR